MNLMNLKTTRFPDYMPIPGAHQVVFFGGSAYGRWPLVLKMYQQSCTDEEMDNPATSYATLIREILVDGKPVKLGLMWYWSSDAFKERFEQYNQIRRGTRVAVVIYRIYMSLDLEEIKRYMDDIVNRSSDKEIPKVLVGYSRGDIEDRREISREEGEAIAREYSCPFFEVSLAKEEDIENLLVTIWRMAHEYDLLKSPPPPQSQDPPPAPPPEPKKKKPCDVQ